jgi:formamidopyrimidine-DNA glycosylase
VGRTIVRARIGDKSLRRRVPIDFSASIEGRRITKLSRRAKYLIVEFDGDDVLLVHLGMSGSLTHRRDGFRDGVFDPRHDHLEFSLDDNSRLVYNDPRRFGMVRLLARAELTSTAELKGLGPEPLSH